MNRRRVVHVSLGTEVGGMEKLLVELARLTDREQFDLTFVSLQAAGALAGEIEMLGWPVVTMDKSLGLKPSLVIRLAKVLRGIRPDVVHTHNTAAYLYGVAAAVIARVPRIIHTRHGRRLQASARGKYAFRAMSRWVDRVVSVSDDTHRLTIDDGLAEPKATVIHNGVDLERFPRRVAHPDGRALVVARLSREKDIASLVRGASLMRERQQVTIPIDVVGDGPERSSLEKLARSLGLEDSIRFHGQRHDIAAVLAESSMFVLPSLTEGISLTLLEAMATGLPVVACRVGGNPEVVVDGQTGILVPPDDPLAIAEAMIRIHFDADLAKRMGCAARERVEQLFCVRRMVGQYEQLYAASVGAKS